MDIFSNESEHRIKSVEKNPPARHPISKNWDTESLSLGEGFNNRLYELNISYHQHVIIGKAYLGNNTLVVELFRITESTIKYLINQSPKIPRIRRM